MENIQERRERVFLVLAGVFFAAMTMLNIIGITRFVQLGPLAVAIGVLPYPLTFLCTDLISELYGKSRANFVVWVGLALNVFVLSVLFMGYFLNPVDEFSQPPWQVLYLAKPIQLPTGESIDGAIDFFYLIYSCSMGAMVASMFAYVTAQFCDVHVFHWLKKKTQGKHLWMRNNFSTLLSQMVDSIMVIGVTFGAALFSGEMSLKNFVILLSGNYLFKMVTALADTLPFYFLVAKLRAYLQLPE